MKIYIFIIYFIQLFIFNLQRYLQFWICKEINDIGLSNCVNKYISKNRVIRTLSGNQKFWPLQTYLAAVACVPEAWR